MRITITGIMMRIILCVLAFFCCICIGIWTERSAHKNQQQFYEANNIYLYDSQGKIDIWFQSVEKSHAEIGADFSKERLEESLVEFKKYIPLVAVGPFGIFYNKDVNGYRILERNVGESHVRTFVFELVTNRAGQETRTIDSKVLDGWIVPHASSVFRYSEDGSFIRGLYSTSFKDGKFNRIYVDTDGTGQFDSVFVYEGENRVKYKLAETAWTKEDSKLSEDEDLNESSHVFPRNVQDRRSPSFVH